MANTIGTIFKITAFGESHGAAFGCVVDGCPSGLELNEKDIQIELDRRRPGQSRITTSRSEGDKVKILSGVFEGKTLGTPIAMIVENKDAKSADYKNLENVFRPGHADFTWEEKYGVRDYRGGGRASGRETVSRVMAGAVAKKLLGKIEIRAFAAQIGKIKSKKADFGFIEKNPVRAADPVAAKKMQAAILQAQKKGDSIGGVVQIEIKNVPAGLGEPVFDKLNADLAKALISIGAVKGIEFGAGFAAASRKGSEINDPLTVKSGKIGFLKNDCGGILGGISTGETIVIRIAVKPTSSISKPQNTITTDGEKTKIEISGRHDPCLVPRIIPVAESMVAIVLADHMLRQKTAKIA